MIERVEDMPQIIKDIIAKWTIKKDEYSEEDRKPWPSKMVGTSFELEGIRYSIGPSDIGLDARDPWDQGFFESLQTEIGEDLKEAGADHIIHDGFLD